MATIKNKKANRSIQQRNRRVKRAGDMSRLRRWWRRITATERGAYIKSVATLIAPIISCSLGLITTVLAAYLTANMQQRPVIVSLPTPTPAPTASQEAVKAILTTPEVLVTVPESPSVEEAVAAPPAERHVSSGWFEWIWEVRGKPLKFTTYAGPDGNILRSPSDSHIIWCYDDGGRSDPPKYPAKAYLLVPKQGFGIGSVLAGYWKPMEELPEGFR